MTEVAGRLDRLIRVVLGFVAAVAPLVMVRDAFDPANLPQSAFIQVAAAVLLTLWVVRGLLSGRFSVPGGPVVPPLLSLLAWSGASLLWARSRYEGAVVLLHWASCAVIGLVAADVAWESPGVRALLRCAFAGGVAVALLGIAQHLFGVSWVPQAFPPAATFVNKNIAAQFAVMIVPLGVALLLGAGKALERGAVALGIALLCAFIFYTHTRSATLALLAEAILILVWAERSRLTSGRTQRRTAILVAGVLLAVGAAHVARFGSDWAVWRTLSAPPAPGAPAAAGVASVRGRLAIWRNTVEMIRDFPLRGVGLGNHALFYPAYSRRAVVDPLFGPGRQLDYVHNEYLQLAAELGLVGLALAAWLGVAVVRTAVGAGRGQLTAALPYVAMGLSAAILGALVDAGFSFPFRRALPPLLIMVAVGLLMALSRDGALRSFVAPRWLGLTACTVGVAGVVGCARLQYRWIESDRSCGRAIAAQARSDWSTAIDAATAARRDNPYRSEPLFVLGSALQATGESRSAATLLEQLVTTYSYDSEALDNLGLAYTQMGDPRRALDCFRRALALTPDEALLHFRAASLLKTLGEGGAALEELKQAARCEPGSAFYQHQWGIAALQRRSYDDAREALERTLALDPGSAEAHKAMGVLLAEVLGRRGEGVEHLRKALALDDRIRDADRMRQMVEAYDRERARPR